MTPAEHVAAFATFSGLWHPSEVADRLEDTTFGTDVVVELKRFAVHNGVADLLPRYCAAAGIAVGRALDKITATAQRTRPVVAVVAPEP